MQQTRNINSEVLSRAGNRSPRLEQESGGTQADEQASLRPPRIKRRQWHEPVHNVFTRAQRTTTTILLFGLTENHDHLIAAAMRSLGYRMEVLPVPDTESFVEGKAYCDRSMCSPTYFFVGHLIRHLRRLRDERGLSTREILDGYLLVTPNGRGPCRFGL